MEKRIKRSISTLVLLMVCLIMANVSFAQENGTIEDAFKGGKISGAIGSYYEFVNRDADNADYGWSNAYLTLKYETLSWKQLKMGARFFAHGQLYSDNEDGVTDPFDVDIESQFTLPELYLDYALMEKTNITIGRWDHQKITHIDDNQSEGGYVQFKEIENLDVVAGIMRRFAEIDYDDGEDFGRNNDSQDLDSETTYGPGSSQYLYFLEGKYRAVDVINLNPYLMYHGDYASVYGIDNKIEVKMEDAGLAYGSDVNYYHVDADITGRGDSNNYVIAPFIDKKPVYLSVGYARFDDGNALIKPAWLRDYFLPVDQLATYGAPDSEDIFSKIKLTLGDFWTHFIYLDSNYATTASLGDGSQEYELQFGYKFFKSLDFNVRLFDVQFDNVDDKDYQKIESHLCFKF
jgi:hypothetical protein